MSLGYVAKSRIAGLIGKCIFTFMGKFQTLLQSDCFIVRIFKPGKLMQDRYMLKYKLIFIPIPVHNLYIDLE